MINNFFRSILFLVGFIVAAIYSIYTINARLEKQNPQLNTVEQNIILPVDFKSNLITSGQKIRLSFMAEKQNLGTVSFLFDNHRRINTDILTIRIREEKSTDWYYQNDYETSKMDIGEYFPVGFPPIINSKGKNYEIEIESKRGTVDNSVSLSGSTKYFKAKYAYTKSLLLNSNSLIPEFILLRILAVIKNISFEDFFNFIILLFSPFLIVYLVTKLIYFLKKYPPWISKKMVFWADLLKKIFSNKKIIFLILLFYIFTRIQFLNYTQYWDASWYWGLFVYAIEKFTASGLSVLGHVNVVLSYFNFLGHPSMAYVGFLSLTQIFARNDVAALNIGNLFLAVLGIYSFYKILIYFNSKNMILNAIMALIFAFNPLFYASSISLSLDFPLLVFTILVLESFLYKKNLSYLFWSLMLVFTKETGFFIYVSIVSSFAVLIFFLKKNYFIWDKKLKQVIYFLLPVAIFGLYVLYQHGKLWNDNDFQKFSFVWNNSGSFCFGFNLSFVGTRLFQIFVMNFAWIKTLVIFIGLYKWMVITNKNKYAITEYSFFLLMLLLIFLAFVSVNLVMMVMYFPRYVVTTTFFVDFFFYTSIIYIFKDKFKILLVSIAVILILMLIQTFYSFDPSARILYGTNYLGRHISSPIYGHTDTMEYNSQFVFLDGLTDAINSDTPKDVGLVGDLSTGYFFKNHRTIGWVEDLPKIKKEGYKKLRYVFVPWIGYQNELLKYVNVLYKVKSLKVLDYRGYYVELYDLEIID
jgi:hypothetical protein